MKIGLTGSIGTGKSTVSNILKQKNIKVIDADNISKKVMESEKCTNQIIETFGDKVVNSKGVINRKLLRDIVFADENNRKLLEKITHPLINEAIKEESEKIKNEKIVIFDIPLLFEFGYNKEMTKTIVVACEEEIQIKRIVTRDKTTREKAQLIIHTQMSQKEKISRADYVICNNGSLLELEKKVDEILEKL